MVIRVALASLALDVENCVDDALTEDLLHVVVFGSKNLANWVPINFRCPAAL